MVLGIAASNFTPVATLNLYDQNGTGPSIYLGGNAGTGDTDYVISRNSNNDSTDNDPFQISRDTPNLSAIR